MDAPKETPHWLGAMRIVAITDRSLVNGEEEFVRRCEALMEGGLRAIVVREKDMAARNLYDLCRRLLPLTRRMNALLIVSDRVDVAMAVGADGVQLSGKSLPARAVRHMVHPGFLVGASCHDRAQLDEAIDGRADYAFVSPVFPPGKKDVPSVMGIEEFESLARDSKIPVIALGGITPRRALACMKAGAAGVAAIGALFGAENPTAAIESFVNSMEATR